MIRIRFMRQALPALLTVVLATGCKEDTSKSPAPAADPHAGHNHPPGEGPGNEPAHDEAAVGPETSGVPVDLTQGWCTGHGVPESVCTRCDESLVAKFKASGDWCGSHNLPESQCIKCNPGAKVKWAALKDKVTGPVHGAPATTQPAEPQAAASRRLLTAQRDPLCDVAATQIRFVDASITQKAGIEVEPAQSRRMAAALEVPAEVEYDGRRLVRVTPRAKGVTVEARAELGDVVQAGDVLALIESPELGEAASRYLELREGLALARADAERAEAVHTGTRQLLAAISTTAPAEDEVDFSRMVAGEAKGKLLTAHAELMLARSAHDRARRLREQSAGSEQTLEAAASALRKADAGFQAAREAAAFESERARLAADKALRIAQTALDVAVRRVRMLGLTPEQIEAIGGDPGRNLARYELRSPVAGQVIERTAVAGEATDEQTALYTVADLSSMWLELNVPERDAALLSSGLPVLFTADGLPGQGFRGELTWISSQVDDRTRTVKARAVLANGHGRIRAKMFGAARIAIRRNSEVLSVPDKAVQTDGCCQLVFVRRDPMVFEPRKVTLGAAANGYVEILDGLARGEPVVTTGSFLMKTEILKSNIGAGCCEVDPGR